jgi:hypothetical protein
MSEPLESISTESPEPESPAPAGTKPEEGEIGRFIDLLNNRARRGDRNSDRLRQPGMVAFVRMAGSLRALQAVSVDENRQRHNLCATARYRLQSGDAFGTLLAAFLNDLKKIMEGRAATELLGQFAPPPSDPRWMRLLESPLREFIAGWQESQQGILDAEQVARLFSIISDQSVLPVGSRLLLFAEVIGSDGDANAVAEWRRASSLLFNALPERFCLVVSGVPQGFPIPTAPHYLELALEPASDDGSEGGKSYRYTDAPLHTDRPTQEDYLGLDSYAAALARFILHPQTKPPLTIGIHGRWGKGKSSFMEMLDAALVKHAPENSGAASRLSRIETNRGLIETLMKRSENQPNFRSVNARQRERLVEEMKESALKHIITVRFNAWQFEDATQTWAGLASIISERLESVLPWWRRMTMRVAYAWKRHRPALLLDLLPLIVVAAVALYLFIDQEMIGRLLALKKSDDSLGSLLKVLVPSGSVLLALWALAWRAIRVVQPVSERVVGYVKRPDHRAQMGYQHRVMEDLQFVYGHLKRYRPDCKVAVYIDDLDRCSDEKIMQILQAINLILASCDFFVFLGVDTEMIHRAIRAHYHRNQEAEVLPASFPEDYLRKILQLSFHLPETSPEKLFDLTSRLFSDRAREALAEQDKKVAPIREASNDAAQEENLDGRLRFSMESVRRQVMVEEVVDTADELEAFRDHQRFLEDNPREIKRLVNVHRLVKILLQQGGISWPVERQRKLVKWLIFCSRWPQLVDDVLEHAAKSPDAGDCLEELIATLDLPDDRSALLKSFASGRDRLSSKEIIGDFTLAARISQMVLVSPEPRRAAAFTAPVENGDVSHSI